MLNRIVLIGAALMAAVLSPPASNKDEAPIISGLSVEPSAGPTGTVYVLSVHISDPQGRDNIVPMLHQLRENRELIQVPLNDEGRDGDLKQGDGIYSGRSNVPKTAAKERHRFEVFMRDKDGNKSNLLEYHFTVLEGVNI